MSVAKIISQQLGNKALFMLGAKSLLDVGNGLSFRIRGSRRVNYIKIILNASDLYDVEFGKVWGHNYKVVDSFDNVYCDGLHSLIRESTGLYTNL